MGVRDRGCALSMLGVQSEGAKAIRTYGIVLTGGNSQAIDLSITAAELHRN